MKNRIHGQSYFSDSMEISQDIKSESDIDIDDIDRMIKDAELIKQQKHDMLVENYNRRMTDKVERFTADTAYNVRLFNYPCGQQLSYYSKAVAYNSKTHEKLTRSYKNEKRTEEEEKHCIDVSLARTKNTIYNIARSNEWKWFVTFTFNREKTDASDHDVIMKRMSKNLDNTKQRRCPNLKYIVVPELHSDKTNYHFHGLFTGCDELQFVFSGKFDKKGRPVFNIPSWSWGWSTATLVGDSASASNYICKYITKDTEHYLNGKRRYLSNADRTTAEKYFIENSKTDIITEFADDISYIKDVVVKPAYRKCTYIELPPDTIEIFEKS